MFITVQMAENAGACSEGLDWFRNNFPDGADHHDLIIALRAADEHGYADWLESEVEDGTFDDEPQSTVEASMEETFGEEFADIEEVFGATSNTIQNTEKNQSMSVTISKQPTPFTPITVTITSKEQLDKLVNDIENRPKQFAPVTITFGNESELHDVVAALAAYGRKTASVASTGIAGELGLSAYSGNARVTVNKLLPQLTAAVNG